MNSQCQSLLLPLQNYKEYFPCFHVFNLECRSVLKETDVYILFVVTPISNREKR